MGKMRVDAKRLNGETAENREKAVPFELPSGLMLGAATASVQIEGGDTNNSWYRFSRSGKIKDGSDCSVTCDHWNRVDQDIALMKELGLQCYRLSLEWSRIEPEEGRFDDIAIDHYRDELVKLRKAGIEPIVTLHHFSNPLWFEDSGCWLERSAVDRFARYVERAVRELGDLVSVWVTINEPNIYMFESYYEGTRPPEHKSVVEAMRVAANMAFAHRKAYGIIHRVRREKGYDDTKVGLAHHLCPFESMDGGIVTRVNRWFSDRLFHRIIIEADTTGRHVAPIGIGGFPDGRRSNPNNGRADGRRYRSNDRRERGQEGRRAGFSDFMGINYYTRQMVSGFKRLWSPDSPKNDLGWEIYPEGLYKACKSLWDKYGLPIWIMENGTPDAKDAFRARYIYDHLYQVKRLADAGVAVQAYVHWSLLDNWEWLEGFAARFGLAETDYATQERKIRKSGRFFADISVKRAVTTASIQAYLELEENGK